MPAEPRLFRPQQFWMDSNTVLDRHPASEEYESAPMSKEDIAEMAKDMKENGYDAAFPIALLNGKIVAGWTRYLASKRACVDFLTFNLPPNADPYKFAERENEARRQLTAEWLRKKREDRIRRVATAHADGESTRTIADREEISQPQVVKDIAAAKEGQVITELSPENNGQEEQEKVKGKDGKSYPASKQNKNRIFCTSCATRARKGQEPERKCRECKAARDAAKQDKKNPDANMDADTPEPEPKVEPMDDLGNKIPKGLRDAFAGNRKSLQDGVKLLFEVRGMCKRLTKWNPYLRSSDLEAAMTKLAEDMKNGLPYGVCDSCAGKGCKDCRNAGWMPKWRVEEMEAKK